MEVPEDDWADLSSDASVKSIRYRRVPVINEEEFEWFYSTEIKPSANWKADGVSISGSEVEQWILREAKIKDLTRKQTHQLTIYSVNSASYFFNSWFESGNLKQAIEIAPHEYDLTLQGDHNSGKSTTQWFYFSVMNIKKGSTIKINISNLYKDDSLYSQGMKPFVYSTKANSLEGQSWRWCCNNINYFRNGDTMECDYVPSDADFSKYY